MENTRDLMDFGRRELQLAGNLLRLFRSDKDHTLRLGDKITPEFNPDTGLVFLVDEEFNVAMINGQYLEDWLLCPHCGTEGFKDTLDKPTAAPCCQSFAKEILD
jgi:hypothetical protein